MHSFAKWENTELIFWWTEVLIQICFVQRWRTEQTIFPCHFAMPQSVMKALDPFYAKAPFLSPPENVSKLEIFWRFQGVLKCSMDLNGLKTYTRALTSSKRFLKTFFNFIYLRLFFFVISCQWKKGLTELSEKCLCRNSVVISERDTEESYLGV